MCVRFPSFPAATSEGDKRERERKKVGKQIPRSNKSKKNKKRRRDRRQNKKKKDKNKKDKNKNIMTVYKEAFILILCYEKTGNIEY